LAQPVSLGCHDSAYVSESEVAGCANFRIGALPAHIPLQLSCFRYTLRTDF